MGELEVNGKTNDIYTFDFSEMGEKAEEAQELDNDFCDNADEAVARAKKALRSFKRLHDLMANHYQGTWRRWLGFRNITKDEAARMLRKYEYVVANGDNADYILQLAESKKRLVDEAARPSTPQELKDGVANGDITSLPQFKKLKAELEATKNVLRTTESKLTSAEQERDEAKQLRNAANDLYNQASRKATEQKARAEQAERERDEAKNELGAMRVSKGNIEAALDKTNADRAKDRETIAQLEVENERLRNQPQAEPEIRVVEKRIEVIPDEYKKAFMENQRMRRELATRKAHEKGQTLQEFAEIEEGYADLQKSVDEERATELKLEAFNTIPAMFNYSGIEAKELVRCYMKYHAHESVKVKGVLDNIEFSINTLTNIRNCLAHAIEAYKQYEEETQKVELRAVK